MANERSDAELLKASYKDAEAFGLFYDRHQEAVRRYFLRRTADQSLTLDLTAETFAEAFASSQRYREVAVPATGWLFTIASRQLNEFWRQERVSKKYRGKLGIDSYASPEPFDRVDEFVDASTWMSALSSALATLSEASAEAVVLRVGHCWTYQQLSAHLGCTPQAARVRVSRALHQLEAQLDAQPPKEFL